MRSDTRRNIRRLVAAAADEVRENPDGVSMQSVAARAEVGLTSAYRYFPSLNELFTAYMVQILEELRDFGEESGLSGSELFLATLERWVGLVLENGAVMVQLRSRSGFLDRLDHADPVIRISEQIWGRPLAGLLADLGLPPSLLRRAMFVCNALSDPREILDLHGAEHLEEADLVAFLSAAVQGAVQGLAGATRNSPGTARAR